MYSFFPVWSKKRSRCQRGFTIIELVVVLIVLGILASVVMLGGTPLSASRRVNIDALKSTIRYAQSRAMKGNTTWGVAWDNTGYWAFSGNNGTSANAVPIPGEESLIVAYPARNVRLAPNTALIAFDVAGRPFTNATLATPLATDLTVTMTATDDATVSSSFIITAETGYLR